MSFIRRGVLKRLKRATPLPKSALRGSIKVALGILAIVLVRWGIGIVHPNWSLEPKDLALLLLPVFALPAGAMVVWLLRNLGERRPLPVGRDDDLRELADTIFEPGKSASGAHRLRRIRLKTRRRVVAATSKILLEEMTDLNCRLFSQSVHGQEYEQKLFRNRSHVEKNPHVIRLIGLSPSGRVRMRTLPHATPTDSTSGKAGEWIGFSHIIPISKETYLRYICHSENSMGIEDVAFPKDCVCGPGERAFAFLIFTIALDGFMVRRWETPTATNLLSRLRNRHSDRWRRHEILRNAERELYIMAFEHLRELYPHHADGSQETRIVAQAFKQSTGEALKVLGFSELENLFTADGEPVYELKVRFD